MEGQGIGGAVVEELRGIRGALNAQAAGQNVTSDVLVKMARVEERLEAFGRSIGNLQKTLVGLAVSLLLTLAKLVMDGALR